MNLAVVAVMFALGVPMGLLGFIGVSLISGLLILLFHVPVHLAYGTSLGSVFATVLAAGWSHYREGNVDPNSAAQVALGGVVGAYLGGSIALATEAGQLKLLTGLVLLVNALVIYLRLRRDRPMSREEEARAASGQPWKETAGCVAVGAGSGFLSGFLGVGGIAWVQTGLLMVKRVDLARVIGTALFGMALASFSGAVRFAQGGQMDLGLLASVVVGMSIGSYFGAKLTRRVPRWIVKTGLVSSTFISGVILILAPAT